MAAAIPAKDLRMQTPSWSASDEQPLPAGPPRAASSNAPPMSSDEHSSAQEPENTDYNRGSSAGDIKMSGNQSDTFQDVAHKQAKVPSFFLSISPSSCAHRPSFFIRLSISLFDDSALNCFICLIPAGRCILASAWGWLSAWFIVFYVFI